MLKDYNKFLEQGFHEADKELPKDDTPVAVIIEQTHRYTDIFSVLEDIHAGRTVPFGIEKLDKPIYYWYLLAYYNNAWWEIEGTDGQRLDNNRYKVVLWKELPVLEVE